MISFARLRYIPLKKFISENAPSEVAYRLIEYIVPMKKHLTNVVVRCKSWNEIDHEIRFYYYLNYNSKNILISLLSR